MSNSYEENLIMNRKALMWKLFNDNQRFVGAWRTICFLREFMSQYLDDEICKLGYTQPNGNSTVAIPAMEHLKELINRSLSDVKVCMESFNSDAKWLNENINKCDSFHTKLWYLLMKQALDYQNRINNVLSRYMEVHAMFVDIIELL